MDTLPARLGVPSFRGIQPEVISSVISGRDTLALAATGMGKTLCYQASSLMLPSWTLVSSPLLALMDDQINSCLSRGIEAFCIKGDMEPDEREKTLEKVLRNNGILFASPEIINAPRGLLKDFIKEHPPGLAVFDEAHCISAWGQGFRPDYSFVGRTLTHMGRLENGGKPAFPILAMTATATDEIIEDIRTALSLQQANVIRGNTHRETISIEVRPVPRHEGETDIEAMFPFIIEDLDWFSRENGVIYCRKRKDVDWLYDALSKDHSVSKHHSGMSAADRQAHSQRFLDGHTSIMIATIGFGMGLDRGDIDYVLHAGAAASPEEWAQEAGRGGRDGRHSWSITYITPGFSRNIRAAFKNRSQGYGAARRYVSQLLGIDGACHNAFLRTWNGGPATGPAPTPCCNQCVSGAQTDIENIEPSDISRRIQDISAKPGGAGSYGFLDDAMFAYGLIDYEQQEYENFVSKTTKIALHGRIFEKDSGADKSHVIPLPHKPSLDSKSLFSSRCWRENFAADQFNKLTAQTFSFRAEKELPDNLFEKWYRRSKDQNAEQEAVTGPVKPKRDDLDFSM